MPDDMDHLQQYNDERNQDALDEHRRAMGDLEMIDVDYCCEDCGRPLKQLTKVRANAPIILCGECSDWYKQRTKLGKMRDGYL